VSGTGLLRLGLLFGLCFIGAIATLIPLGPGGGMVPPDLVFCLVLAWVLRAPEPVPIWALVLLGLMADVLVSRPIGLGALGLVLAAEVMRSLRPRLGGAPFPLEWLAAAVLFALVLAGMHVALRLVFTDVPPAMDLVRYHVATVISYPVAALAAGVALRRRRADRGGLT